MTAEEARTLMSGSMKRKGLIFKTRIAWICGILNKRIENAAESGEDQIHYHGSKSFSEKYYPLIAGFYRDLGFSVLYNSGRYSKVDNEMVIHWNLESYSFYERACLFRDFEHLCCTEEVCRRYEEERRKREKANDRMQGKYPKLRL